MLPQDPYILLSYLNMKLRDQYDTLEALCDDLSLSVEEVAEKLSSIGYSYDPTSNQFRS